MLTCLSEQEPDRTPVAFWKHFPVDDQEADSLAEATLQFQKNYDLDIVKITPASSYCLKDWGVEDRWNGNLEGTRDYTKRVIQNPNDWEKLKLLTPSAHHLAEQIKVLKRIKNTLGATTPILQTIFSPLAQAKNLSGNDVLLDHLRGSPEAVMAGLRTIAESTRRFVEACVEAGVDGIFYAVQHAQAGILRRVEYLTYGIPNDLRVLEPARSLWCNLLHLHGREIYFDLVESFAFPIINWHDRETRPSLTEAREQFGGALCGGLHQDTLVFGSHEEVLGEAHDALRQTGGSKFILGTGCVVPIVAPHGSLAAVRKAVE